MIDAFDELLHQYPNLTDLPIAIADITFEFPPECRYPSLSVQVEEFGLINPLQGRTVATLSEIHLALYQGAKIIYHDVVIIANADDEEKSYVFREHLYRLYKLRKAVKESDQELLQQLYKTYSNSLYGKVAQGIRERKMFNTREGTTKSLPKSLITNAYYAAMTTGLIRAALSSIIVALDELIEEGYPYKLISATTDGLLYGIDENLVDIERTLDMQTLKTQYDSMADALKNGFKRFKPFDQVDPVLSERLEQFPSLRLMKYSHEAWKDPEYIEIKHVANRVLNVKTRGQVGFYESDDEKVCTILAKAGHKIEGDKDQQAEWMLVHYRDTEVQTYGYTRLSNIQAIIDQNDPINDLISIPETRKISLDYDYKRYPINAHDTAPHKDMNQFMKYRQSTNYLRSLNQRASVDAVDFKYRRAQQNIRKSGGNKKYCIRHIIRAMVHGVKPFKPLNFSYSQLAHRLREFGVTVSSIKHAKQSSFTPNMIEDTSGNRACIRRALKTLEIPARNNYATYLKLLLHKKISNKEEVSYLD